MRDAFLRVKKEENNYMAKNSLFIKLQAIFDKVKSLVNIKKDIKAIEAKLSKIKIQGTLNNITMKMKLKVKRRKIRTSKNKSSDFIVNGL